VWQVAVDEYAKLLGVGKRRYWAVDQAHDLAQMDFGGISAQLVAALGSAHAFDHAGVLQFEEDEFQKFFWKIFFVSDLANLDGALVMMAASIIMAWRA